MYLFRRDLRLSDDLATSCLYVLPVRLRRADSAGANNASVVIVWERLCPSASADVPAEAGDGQGQRAHRRRLGDRGDVLGGQIALHTRTVRVRHRRV